MSAADVSALTLLKARRPLIIGHRGYAQFAPENTLPSFRFAWEAGADLVELDYGHSRDGVPIVMHDPTLDRTSDAPGRWGGANIPVAAHTAEEIRTLDAGRWFNPLYQGIGVPLLEDALEWIRRHGGVTLIERKDGDAATCVRLLREKHLINQVVVQSFDWAYLKAVRDMEPTQVLGALGPPKRLVDGTAPTGTSEMLSAASLDELLKSGAQVAVWNDHVSRESIALAHQRGLAVWVYTINDPGAANTLLDMGVDGLITDNPGLMWRTMALRGVART